MLRLLSGIDIRSEDGKVKTSVLELTHA